MEQLKLVIWDLDETFWNGTLSEGEVTPKENCIAIVKELTNRGIINSISSKNNFEQAKNALMEWDIWDYFVFPTIDWEPKGANVKMIIDNCQLRNPSVLFIDDNTMNLREVEYYNPGIQTMNANEVDNILAMLEAKGKDDTAHSRLKQYKILEKKASFKTACSDNVDFLRKSEITISVLTDLMPLKARVLELINRTNQLNFTKERLDENQVEALLTDSQYECAAVKVTDKFGDYGICGFYALNKKERKLKHFLFSCRILNLGVEEFIYQKLDKPSLTIVQPVSSLIDSLRKIDWITENENIDKEPAKKSNTSKKVKILFVGGCDLSQLCHYIDCNKFTVVTDFNYPNKRGVPVHREHTVYLRDNLEATLQEKNLIAELPFGDDVDDFFDMKLFEGDYDILVYSPLMNYTHDVYRHKKSGFKVAIGGYGTTESYFHSMNAIGEVERFENEYVFEGQQTVEDFKEDLKWLISKIKKPIIFLNGSEVPDFNPNEKGACNRHKIMNLALNEVVADHVNCFVIDVRKYVTSRREVKDNLRHYQRTVYVSLAEDVMSLVSQSKIKAKKVAVYKVIFKDFVNGRIINLLRLFYHLLKRGL